MRYFREFRNTVFEDLSEKRYKRILACIFFIAIIWIMADVISGSFEFRIVVWHDILCILLGITMEYIIPWGKDESAEVKRLRQANHKLVKALDNSTNLLRQFVEKAKEDQKGV